jgi:molecular chaperone DnaK
MSKEDIDRAVRDAERFAEEDKKQKEAVDVKNHADTLIFQSEKTLGEIGDKLPESDLAEVKAGIEKLKETVKSDNTDAIKADTDALEKVFYDLSSKLYQQAQQQGADMGGEPNDDGTINADFTDKTE